MDLKSYKNLGTSKNQGNSFAILDNEHLMHVAKSAHISLGADIQHMTDNIDIMKSEEVKKCDNFIMIFLKLPYLSIWNVSWTTPMFAVINLPLWALSILSVPK